MQQAVCKKPCTNRFRGGRKEASNMSVLSSTPSIRFGTGDASNVQLLLGAPAPFREGPEASAAYFCGPGFLFLDILFYGNYINNPFRFRFWQLVLITLPAAAARQCKVRGTRNQARGPGGLGKSQEMARARAGGRSCLAAAKIRKLGDSCIFLSDLFLDMLANLALAPFVNFRLLLLFLFSSVVPGPWGLGDGAFGLDFWANIGLAKGREGNGGGQDSGKRPKGAKSSETREQGRTSEWSCFGLLTCLPWLSPCPSLYFSLLSGLSPVPTQITYCVETGCRPGPAIEQRREKEKKRRLPVGSGFVIEQDASYDLDLPLASSLQSLSFGSASTEKGWFGSGFCPLKHSAPGPPSHPPEGKSRAKRSGQSPPEPSSHSLLADRDVVPSLVDESDTCITASGTETYAALQIGKANRTLGFQMSALGCYLWMGLLPPNYRTPLREVLKGFVTPETTFRLVDVKLRSRTRRAIKSFCKTSKLSRVDIPKQQAPRYCHREGREKTTRSPDHEVEPLLQPYLVICPVSGSPSLRTNVNGFANFMLKKSVKLFMMIVRTRGHGLCVIPGASAPADMVVWRLWSPPLDLKYEHLILVAGLGLSLSNPRIRDIAEKTKVDFKIVVKEPLRRPFSHPVALSKDLSAEHIKRTIFDSFKAPFFENTLRRCQRFFRTCSKSAISVIPLRKGLGPVAWLPQITRLWDVVSLVEIEVNPLDRHRQENLRQICTGKLRHQYELDPYQSLGPPFSPPRGSLATERDTAEEELILRFLFRRLAIHRPAIEHPGQALDRMQGTGSCCYRGNGIELFNVFELINIEILPLYKPSTHCFWRFLL
ncbi:hypothetical protein CCUS01_14944 [Colletotrichum cuscutae]|uniref:Uncharacterized protein n=1 Tax=Colletotrichum cuscutae TaxID=1209917 RepID=A0AAI9Y596_9PEZI|nr:hypothetical protein CCUS01_14944 [Colletotrichum cuscutae]